MSIRNSFLARIASMLILFAMVPTAFLLVALLQYNQNAKESSAAYNIERELDGIATALEVLVSNIENTASVLASDQTLQRVSKLLRLGATIGQEIDGYRDICEVISLTSMLDYMGDVKLYLPDGQLMTKQRVNIFGLSDLNNITLPRRMMESSLLNSGWTLDKDGVPTYYYRVVYTPKSNPMIALTLPKERLYRLFRDAGLDGAFTLYYEDTEYYATGGEEGDVARDMIIGDWLLSARVVSAKFAEAPIQTGAIVAGMLFVTLLVIPLTAYLFTRSINITVNTLAMANVALTRREYRRIDENSSVRELKLLQRTHNQMVDSIQELIQNVYEARHARDQAELTCLFEQVKPHFLYNTLEGGKWLAMQEGASRTAQFMEKLAAFYRIGLSQGSAFVLLSSELEHVRQYVDLMNLRYSDKITLNIRAECDADRLLVLKLILQPLVENAIEHGLHLTGHDGEIDLYARVEGERLLIDLADTGIGMDADKIEKFNAGDFLGYGLDNVRKRLRIYYGADAELRAQAGAKGGLTISLKLRREVAPFNETSA